MPDQAGHDKLYRLSQKGAAGLDLLNQRGVWNNQPRRDPDRSCGGVALNGCQRSTKTIAIIADWVKCEYLMFIFSHINLLNDYIVPLA